MEWTKDKFYRIYEEYNGMVYRLCMLYLKNESDAGDAVQDIFLKMWEKEPVFANEVHVRAWLFRTTKHRCLDILKSGWFKRRVDHEPDLQQIPQEQKEEYCLLEKVQKLPKKYREVLYFYYYEEYSVKEISAMTGIKESTIQSRLSAARKQLKMMLETRKEEEI